jgi:hypothetical protein
MGLGRLRRKQSRNLAKQARYFDRLGVVIFAAPSITFSRPPAIACAVARDAIQDQFEIETVPADGTSAANWVERRFRSVFVL